MNITLTIPVNRASKLVNGICRKRHYEDQVYSSETDSMIPNPESKTAFAKRQILEMLRSFYIDEVVSELNVEGTRTTANNEFDDCSVE